MAHVQRDRRRALLAAVTTCGTVAVLAGWPVPMGAQNIITVKSALGNRTQITPGARLAIPVVIDMSEAGGATLTSLALGLRWNSTRLTFDSVKAAGFGTLTPNTSSAATGTASLSLTSGAGTAATVTAATMYFTAASTIGGTIVTLEPTASASSAATNLLPLIRVRDTDVCEAPTGKWGDSNGDEAVNIIDAQQIARFAVSLPVADPPALSSQGDVTGDNTVNIIDAQQIARFSVGLSAAARVNAQAFAPPAVASLTVPNVWDAAAGSVNRGIPAPSSLLVGTQAQAQPLGKDAGGADVTPCAAFVYASSNPAAATVSASGLVMGVAAGTSLITVSSGSASASFSVTVVNAVPALQLVASGFSLPVFLTAPPGDLQRLFVVEQTGRIRVVRQDTPLATPFLDLGSAITTGGERGLLGLAFHPQFASNGFFYVNYTDLAGHTNIVRYHAPSGSDVADASSATPILFQTQPFDNHNGGMLAFGPDGYLYIGFGDGGSGGDPNGNGQNRGTWLGKILRIDVNGAAPYAVPPSNPFVGQAGARPEIWALGLRNPWRFSFDRLTGDLYIGDVGQAIHEEIDVEAAGSAGGRNYGWNVTEGLSCFNAPTCVTTGFTAPVLDYTHSASECSVTGGYAYRGPDVPALLGLYIYSDYCSGWIRSFRLGGGSATQHTEWPQLTPGIYVSSFGEDGRGTLYITHHTEGKIYRVVGIRP